MDTIKQQTNEKLLNMITSLTYCMMDVLHTMLMDCEKYMKVCGKGLCREEKRKWNLLFFFMVPKKILYIYAHHSYY